MPLRFWKKDKPEKGKEDEEPAKPSEMKEKATPVETKEKAPEPAATKAEGKKAEAKSSPPATPVDVTAVIDQTHAALVELGLTVPPTKAVFAKRVAAYPGGASAFLADYRSEPYRAVTRVLGDWLGIRVPEVFDPDALLSEVNLRLSSFKLNVTSKDPSWLDQGLNLRKAKIGLGDQEKVVRFKDARDLLKGINELLVPRKIAWLELETWTDDYVFILVREPRWDKIAATDLVVVKADQTAKGGECGECGAPVGKYWSDCLKCGAVFS
ncbi:MAG: hypothetical protein L3J78_04080 [Thermoplasmata archaeon]|nr:hypothetical protein [Thermoplasmata archaeon]